MARKILVSVALDDVSASRSVGLEETSCVIKYPVACVVLTRGHYVRYFAKQKMGSAGCMANVFVQTDSMMSDLSRSR